MIHARRWGSKVYVKLRDGTAAAVLRRCYTNVTPLLLWQCYCALRKDAAAGVDGVTWQEYEKQLCRGRMHELHRGDTTGDTSAEPNSLMLFS